MTRSFLKKKTTQILVALFLLLGLLAPLPATAQNTNELCGGANLTFDRDAQSCNRNAQGEVIPRDERATPKFNRLIANIVNIFSVIVGIIAVIMIIYGGFRFITSGGDSGNVTAAKNTILYAIVGLIIVALAQIIVKFVLSKIG